MQWRDTARGPFVITKIENPWFVFIGTNWIRTWERRVALPQLITAVLDQLAHVYDCIATNHDVVAAWAKRIPGSHSHKSLTRMAKDLESANHSPSNQITVMESVFIDNVALEPVEIVVGKQLPRKETRPAETLKAAANRTADYRRASSSGRCESHKILLADKFSKNLIHPLLGWIVNQLLNRPP